MDLCLKWEEEGFDALEPEEAVKLAHWLIATGLIYSAGRYGRFVRDVADIYGLEEEDNG